ncbi:porin [Termitidicoccus mucosus]|uniref:Porin n=1 Tax=Termitidicoccus mucosus TaxID=1184151 RepID=A0A178IIU6_9BACT|nr:hypothetical protein AW736_10885 [Opitutaceae bacterium TSB47]
MKHTKRKLAGLALASSLILATAASAKIAVGDYVDLSGYVGASARYQKTDRDQGVADDDSAKLDLDAVKLSADIKYNALSAKVSAFMPGSTLDEFNSDDIFITEAYLSYDFGNGYTVSGGRFLSWIGYEAFDLDQQWSLESGLGDMSYLVPNFHNGVRVQYTSGKITLGAALLDSVYNGEDAYTGDADVRNGLGGEFMIRYQDEAFSFGTTLAVEKNTDADYSRYTADLWAQYYLANTKTTFGAEFIYGRWSFKNTPSDTVDYAVMVSARQPIMERLSVAGSVAFGKGESAGMTDMRYQKVAVAPTYVLSENLEARAEVSWTNYDRAYTSAKDRYFAGVQMVFKF